MDEDELALTISRMEQDSYDLLWPLLEDLDRVERAKVLREVGEFLISCSRDEALEARAEGASYSRLGWALGITRQSAHAKLQA